MKTKEVLRNKNKLEFTSPNSNLSMATLPFINIEPMTPYVKINHPAPLSSPLCLENGKSSIATDDSVRDYLCQVEFYDQVLAIDDTFCEQAPYLDINEDLSASHRMKLENVISKCYLNPVDVTITPHPYEMNIRLTNDTPLYSAPRRLSYNERMEVQKILDKLLANKIIKPSQSPYASAVVLVKKKNGETRMCVDFRALHKITARDNFPIPLIEDCIAYLGEKKYFSTLDFT